MSASVSVKQHHKKDKICATRPKYREGRQPKGVKVYTVSQESKYLLVQGVPAVGAQQELVKVFALYGPVEEYRLLDEYPAEDFTEVFWIKYKTIQSARIAKKKLDDYSFFGGVLHVCYAPEYETIQDTREKLQDRRKAISKRIRQLDEEKGSRNEVALAASKASSSTESAQNETASRDQSTVAGTQSQNLVASSNGHFGSAGKASISTTSANKLDVLTTAAKDHQKDSHDDSEREQSIPLSLPPPPQRPPPSWELQHPPQPRREHVNMLDYHPSGRFPAPCYHGGPHHFHHQPFPPPRQPPRPFHGQGPWTRHRNHWTAFEHQPSLPLPNYRPTRQHTPQQGFNTTTQSKDIPASGLNNKPERTIDGLAVRDYKVKTKNPPKFVPRQLTKKSQNLKRLHSDSETETSVAKQPKTENNSDKDPVNSELRKSAFVLGDITGPSLPEPEEKKRQVFQKSEMGNSSLEQTMMKIRQKVKEFSAKALPPQVLKKLKKR